jgi:hypothetical protein
MFEFASPQGRAALERATGRVAERHGGSALRKATALRKPRGIATKLAGGDTGPTLDDITGYGGLPAGQITLLRGHGSSGKLALGIAMLASLQHSQPKPLACIDVTHHIDPASLAARGVNLDALILAHPPDAPGALAFLCDLLKAQSTSGILLNSLSELVMDSGIRRLLGETITHVVQLARMADVPVICLYDPTPLHTLSSAAHDVSAVHSAAALVLECTAARAWVDDLGRIGIRVQVKCTRSRFAREQSTTLEFWGP